MPRADSCVCLLESVNSLPVDLTRPGQVSGLQLSSLLFQVPKWQQFSPVAGFSSATQPGEAGDPRSYKTTEPGEAASSFQNLGITLMKTPTYDKLLLRSKSM